MSKILIGIAAVTSGLALIISMSANAAPTPTSRGHEGDSQTFNKELQLLNTTVEMIESESRSNQRFPLILPQPTKINDQNSFDLG